jgi:hypothetical protein
LFQEVAIVDPCWDVKGIAKCAAEDGMKMSGKKKGGGGGGDLVSHLNY